MYSSAPKEWREAEYEITGDAYVRVIMDGQSQSKIK